MDFQHINVKTHVEYVIYKYGLLSEVLAESPPLPADVVSQIFRGEEVEDIPVVLPGRLSLSPLSDSDDSDLDEADSFMPTDTTLLDSNSADDPLRPVTTARRSARTSNLYLLATMALFDMFLICSLEVMKTTNH